MKKFTYVLAAMLLLASCYSEVAERYDDTTITLYPEAVAFNADGTTANGDESYIAAVNVRQGASESRQSWEIDSDSNVGWAETGYANYVSQYKSVKGDGMIEVVEKGIEVVMSPNNGYKRVYNLVLKTEDGTTKTFSFTQLGLLADAEVNVSVESVDLSYLGGESDPIEYTTNMDEYSYEIRYEGDQKDWLTIVDKGLGKVALNAAPWNSETENRTAVLVICAGTPDTSIAYAEVQVTQLKLDTYYYVFGSSTGITRANAPQMTKIDNDVFTYRGFFYDAGSNLVCLNKNGRSETYPVYYLAADGSIKSSDSEVSTSDISIAANGIYTLTADFKSMTWTMERNIKAPTCMPDSELENYPVKDYPTADGGVKTWMTVGLHWNGGSSVGSIKLGSGLVGGHQTGGYGTPAVKTEPYTQRNSAYDTEENGGSVVELMAADGNTLASKHGRLYSSYEMITGVPNGCLNDAYQMDNPYGEPGETYTDDAGLTVELENILVATLAAYPATAEGDALAESEHPSLKLQIQGICPFGWHLANMQDWKDLIWAASQASQGSDRPINPSMASYKAIGGGTLSNFASILYSADWKTYSASLSTRSNAADAFGWNMFIQGWRLYASGYDYGATDETPRFYIAIPLMGQYTASKRAFWRMYVTGQSADMTSNDGFDIGNGSGGAVRCVKNYKSH